MNSTMPDRRRDEPDHAGDDEDVAELDLVDAVLLGDRAEERGEADHDRHGVHQHAEEEQRSITISMKLAGRS
jgi:hypothetical protein